MNGPVLDTMILVGYLRGHPPAIEYLSGYDAHARPLTHAITVAELLQGTESKGDLRAVDRLLASFDILRPTPGDFSECLALLRAHRLKTGIGFADCLLAATCLRLDLPLATRNVKHFRAITKLRAVKPY